MNLLRRILIGIASAFGAMSLLSLLLYPVYKHLYAGFVFVILGGMLALLPAMAPAATRGIAARLGALSDRQWLMGITIAAILVRIPVMLFPAPPISDFEFYLTHGQAIADGRGFGDFISYPPGQSGWLSFWIRLGGSDLHYLVVIQCLVSLVTIRVTYAGFARYSPAAARWASAAVALYPSIVMWSGVMGHETLVMLLEAILFWLLGKAEGLGRKEWWWVLCGLTTGAAALVRPTFTVVPALMAVCLALSGYKLRRAFIAGVVMLCCMLAVIAPWTWRNYKIFHDFALVSTNFGTTLLSSNHPLSDGIYMPTAQYGEGLNPIATGRLQQKMAIEAIKADPVRFVRLTFKRIVYMWGAETSIPDEAYGPNPSFGQQMRQVLRGLVQFFWAAFAVACFAGTTRFRRSWTFGEAPVLWAIAWVLFICGLHAVIEPQARHHMALIPLLAGVYLPSYGKWLIRA